MKTRSRARAFILGLALLAGMASLAAVWVYWPAPPTHLRAKWANRNSIDPDNERSWQSIVNICATGQKSALCRGPQELRSVPLPVLRDEGHRLALQVGVSTTSLDRDAGDGLAEIMAATRLVKGVGAAVQLEYESGSPSQTSLSALADVLGWIASTALLRDTRHLRLAEHAAAALLTINSKTASVAVDVLNRMPSEADIFGRDLRREEMKIANLAKSCEADDSCLLDPNVMLEETESYFNAVIRTCTCSRRRDPSCVRSLKPAPPEHLTDWGFYLMTPAHRRAWLSANFARLGLSRLAYNSPSTRLARCQEWHVGPHGT